MTSALPARSLEGQPPAERRSVATAHIARAVEFQRRVFQATGRWIRLCDILLMRSEIGEEQRQQLLGTALFAGLRDGAPEADLVGEVALRKGLITVARFIECIEAQLEDAAAKRPHRLIGTILLERGYVSAAALADCEADLDRETKLLRDAERRIADSAGEVPALSPIDAHYVAAARKGDIPEQDVMSALAASKRLERVLGRRVALWEELLFREVVEPREHLRALRRTCTVQGDPSMPWLLGGILVELGFATVEDVEDALNEREAQARRTGGIAKPLGEILVLRGVLTREELEEALRIQAFRRGEPRPDEAARRGRRRRLRLPRLSVRPLLAALALLALVWAFGLPSFRLRRSAAALADPKAALADRIQAVRDLAAEGDEDALAAVVRAAEDRGAPAELRMEALRAVAGSPAARDAVARAIDSDLAGQRAVAAWALGERRDEAARAALRRRAGDDSDAVRLAAARGLALFEDPAGRESLVAALADGAPERARLSSDLGLPDTQVAAALAKALETLSGFRLGFAHERWQAWLALQPVADELVGRQRGRAAVARLVPLLRSDRLSVRFGAARALAHLGDARGLHLIARALDRGDAAFRATLLEERGIDVERIEPELAALASLLAAQGVSEAAPEGAR